MKSFYIRYAVDNNEKINYVQNRGYTSEDLFAVHPEYTDRAVNLVHRAIIK